MAEILNQNQIDALLSEIEPQESQESGKEKNDNPDAYDPSKVIRIPKRNIPRPYNPYHSPVVKSGRILLNPSFEVESQPECVVVRTLANYVQLRKQRRNDSSSGPRKAKHTVLQITN